MFQRIWFRLIWLKKGFITSVAILISESLTFFSFLGEIRSSWETPGGAGSAPGGRGSDPGGGGSDPGGRGSAPGGVGSVSFGLSTGC